jgi:hypothetical protein
MVASIQLASGGLVELMARFPLPRACDRCGFGERTFAGTRGSDGNAPVAVIPIGDVSASRFSLLRPIAPGPKRRAGAHSSETCQARGSSGMAARDRVGWAQALRGSPVGAAPIRPRKRLRVRQQAAPMQFRLIWTKRTKPTGATN